MANRERKWMTVKDAAEYAGYDVATLYRWKEAGYFAYFQKPGARNASIRINRESFLAFIDKHVIPAVRS